jgi:hypothetical protein
LGRNASSEGSSRAATTCARRRSLRSASSRYSSSADVWKISRCSAVTARASRALISGSASAADWSAGRSISAASLISSR